MRARRFDGLPCASLDRVIGRNVDLWLRHGGRGVPAGRAVRRLQNEVQMLLYTDPLTEAREARGLAGQQLLARAAAARASRAAGARPQVDDRLRAPVLADDWAAWADAWRALDAGPLAACWPRRGAASLTLTLCGERHAQRLAAAPRSLWRALQQRWQPVDAAAWLEAL